jgi:AhpD family alkylhydroperoxidase
MLETPKARQQWRASTSLRHEIAALLAMSKAVEASGLERELLELVKLRSSQLNGCAFCLQMHATDARKMGMSEKMQLLAAWREAPVYSSRERAAIAWTEFDLVASHHGVSDESTTMPYRFRPRLSRRSRRVSCLVCCSKIHLGTGAHRRRRRV